MIGRKPTTILHYHNLNKTILRNTDNAETYVFNQLINKINRPSLYYLR